MILTSTIPAGSFPLAGNSWAIRGLLPIMWQWSIGEQEAAHKLQTDYLQYKELTIFPGGSHWKQQQKFSILMKDSTLETEKQKIRKFSRSLNPIQTPYDSQWNWWDLTHWKKPIHPQFSWEAHSVVQKYKIVHIHHMALTNAQHHTNMAGVPQDWSCKPVNFLGSP